MRRIQKISLFFRIIFQFIFLLLPLILVVGWIYAPKDVLFLHPFQFNVLPTTYLNMIEKGNLIMSPLSVSDRILGFSFNLIFMGITLYIVYCLIKLFKLYEDGEIFSLTNVSYLKKIGYGLLINQLCSPIYQGILGVILTYHNAKGQRLISIGLDQTDLGMLLLSLLVILISWIMTEGCKLKEEQQLTI